MKQKNRVIRWIAVILGVALLLLALRQRTAEASPAHALLRQSLARLTVAEPGQVTHYRFVRTTRPPPAGLEPRDPYHLPYSAIWPAYEIEENWAEFGADGTTSRWRTQLWSADGILLQDLLYDGSHETDYFPQEQRAETFPQERGRFRDMRIALIEDFLQKTRLTRRNGQAPNGQAVVSVYTASRLAPTNYAYPSVDEALMGFERPFQADLRLTEYAVRVDFDPSTLLPIGEAQVGWDAAKQEHVLTYRTVEFVEVVAADKADALFEPATIPAEAFEDRISYPLGESVPLAEAGRHLGLSLHIQTGPAEGWELRTPFAALPELQTRPAFFGRGVEVATSTGAGVDTIYLRADGATITLTEGPPDRMLALLHTTPPTWREATPIKVRLGEREVTAWQLQPGYDPKHLRYVIETGASLLWIDAHDLSSKEIEAFLLTLTPLS